METPQLKEIDGVCELTQPLTYRPLEVLTEPCLWSATSNGAAAASASSPLEGISIGDKMEAAEHGMAMLRLCDRLHPGLSAERGAILLSMATMLQQVLSQVSNYL